MERVDWPTTVQAPSVPTYQSHSHTHTHLTFNAWSVCNATFDLFTFDIIKKNKKYKIVYISNCLRQSTRDDWQKEQESMMCFFLLWLEEVLISSWIFFLVFISLIGGGVFARAKNAHIQCLRVHAFFSPSLMETEFTEQSFGLMICAHSFLLATKNDEKTVWKPLQNNINNYNKMKSFAA